MQLLDTVSLSTTNSTVESRLLRGIVEVTTACKVNSACTFLPFSSQIFEEEGTWYRYWTFQWNGSVNAKGRIPNKLAHTL